TAFNCSAFLGGQPYLFVKDLTGNGPKLRLDAVSSGTGAAFSYEINAELQLLDDLEITGNGTQNFLISGGIKDFWHPRNVTKTGTSTVTLTGNNTFAGNFSIQQGQIKVTSTGAINGASSIMIGNGATFSQSGGLVAVNSISNTAGGSYQFTGG